VIDRAADAVGRSLDIERLLGLARPSSLCAPREIRGIPPLGGQIAVARDDAFCFVYPALLDGWQKAGAGIDFFSPLADEPPPRGTDAVYLPGGYPELWAGRLAASSTFLAGLRQAAADGRPVYGECGGYMTLGKALIDARGTPHRMAELLPLVSSFREPRLSLGYRRAALIADGPLGRAGSPYRGHEFHYATIVREGEADRLWRATDAAGAILGACGLRRGSVFGSFLHLIDGSDDPEEPAERPFRV
jgi:cobyrinic acid a,c-diamide synthase